MVGAVREPDHGPQAFHAHALSLTDLLDENRLLPVGQVFRVCTRLFSQQLQRAPADRDLDVELPLLPPLPLDVGVQLVQTGLHPRQPLLHRRQRVRQTVRIPRTGGHRAHPNHGPCAASIPGSFPAFSRHVRLLGSGEHLSFPFSHDRGLHAQFGGRLMRFQPSGRDRHHRLPLQLLGHRPVSQPAPAGRQLVDPRHEQFLAFRIAEHPHGAAEPSAALEVMVHRRALLLLAVTPLPFPTSGRHAGALLLQPLPVPHPQGFLAGIPKLMDRIRGATLVSDIQVHRPIPLLPAIRHDNALLDSTSPRKRHHLTPNTFI